MKCETVFKVNEGRPNIADLIKQNEISLIINTPLGKTSHYDEQAIRKSALQFNVPFAGLCSGQFHLRQGVGQITPRTPFFAIGFNAGEWAAVFEEQERRVLGVSTIEAVREVAGGFRDGTGRFLQEIVLSDLADWASGCAVKEGPTSCGLQQFVY